MLQCLSAAIDGRDLQIISMRMEGDGPQNPELFMRPVEKVLRELVGDMRLAGHQHFAFHEYKDPRGNRIFAGDANGSVSFQLAQTSGFLPPTMSYVTYDVVRRPTRHRRSDVRHRMSHRTYDIARTIFKLWTYDIVRTMSYVLFTSYVHVRHRMLDVRHRVYTSYTTSYVKLNMQHRTCTTSYVSIVCDVVRAILDVRCRMSTYDIVYKVNIVGFMEHCTLPCDIVYVYVRYRIRSYCIRYNI